MYLYEGVKIRSREVVDLLFYLDITADDIGLDLCSATALADVRNAFLKNEISSYERCIWKFSKDRARDVILEKLKDRFPMLVIKELESDRMGETFFFGNMISKISLKENIFHKLCKVEIMKKYRDSQGLIEYLKNNTILHDKELEIMILDY